LSVKPPKPSDEKLSDLVWKLRSGDTSVIEEIAHRHMTPVQIAAGPFIGRWPKHRDSFVAVALEGMMEAINKARLGHLYDNNITPYISKCVQASLRGYQEKMLKPVYVSNYLHNETGDEVVVYSLDAQPADFTASKYIEPESQETEDIMETLGFKEIEKKMLRLRMQGYTYVEIAEEVGMTKGGVILRIQRLRPKARRAQLEGVI
jgi:DNA-directed RNA polymerase specialized sigma subunit